MNVRLAPKYFVSDGSWAYFVEGYTSDDIRDWALRLAMLLPNGQPDMTRVYPYWDAMTIDPSLPLIEGSDVINIKHLIGNTQRACQHIPTIRKAN